MFFLESTSKRKSKKSKLQKDQKSRINFEDDEKEESKTEQKAQKSAIFKPIRKSNEVSRLLNDLTDPRCKSYNNKKIIKSKKF